ncbi:MAG: hypothetical protein QX189_10980 [Methylococcales bacterium]
MNNDDVVAELKKCVKKLEKDGGILKEKRASIPSDNDKLIQQQKDLNSLIAEMLAKQNSLEAIINEREVAKHPILPLEPDLVAKFNEQMNKLNVVIQADQKFDKFVAIAKSINSAAADMKTTTAVKAAA